MDKIEKIETLDKIKYVTIGTGIATIVAIWLFNVESGMLIFIFGTTFANTLIKELKFQIKRGGEKS